MTAFYLSATHKSSGKTSLSIGLAAAMRQSGRPVQTFKKGPDYIDPLWHARASGRPCYNLDFNTQGREEILALYRRKAQGAEVVLVEGNKGLFDGMDLLGSDSNAAMALLLDLPIVLVLDVQGIIRGVAPLLLGYSQFQPGVRLAGVILNKVGGSRHEAKVRQTIEHYTDIPILGAVHRSEELRIEERHLGLVPSNEAAGVDATIARFADRVREQVDLSALLALRGPSLGPVPTEPVGRMPDVRLAIARDAAFGFYYADDLEALERAGARLLPFSPLHDGCMPKADGLFLGGGFPETHMESLAANGAMLESIRRFIRQGGPCYAECGGLMYLCRELRWRGRAAPMAGVISADAVMYDQPQGRGYVLMQQTPAHPWPGGDQDRQLPVHEFHYSRLENLAPGHAFAYSLSRGMGIDGSRDGLISQNLLASYGHQRQVAGNPWADRFLAFIRQCRGAAAKPSMG
ncbi:cobyrinate a,c-diamide synthase [Magnetovirga frankeli]|uniref:cobyrinate a,c-diamide synthase n=1 Tax=Magnetovirga frankeli TaxID=947516 RepID=UPI0012937DBE|nr:cobyrinate a,c-diamide synthase [gamma proteobacterium SS-5]